MMKSTTNNNNNNNNNRGVVDSSASASTAPNVVESSNCRLMCTEQNLLAESLRTYSAEEILGAINKVFRAECGDQVSAIQAKELKLSATGNETVVTFPTPIMANIALGIYDGNRKLFRNINFTLAPWFAPSPRSGATYAIKLVCIQPTTLTQEYTEKEVVETLNRNLRTEDRDLLAVSAQKLTITNGSGYAKINFLSRFAAESATTRLSNFELWPNVHVQAKVSVAGDDDSNPKPAATATATAAATAATAAAAAAAAATATTVG